MFALFNCSLATAERFAHDNALDLAFLWGTSYARFQGEGRFAVWERGVLRVWA